MDARLDTLSIELYQMNIRVGRIAWQQAIIGGFASEASPPPPPMASNFEAEDDDDDGDDDDAFDDNHGAEFEMSMIGELNHFHGLQICLQELGIFISQSKYAKNLVKRFGLESASFVKTPMSPNVKLIVDLLRKSVDWFLYKSMIGSLLYLTTSRLDISYSVGVCAKYQANFRESHMIALKRIIKYIKTTVDFGVWYSKDTNDVLARYFDANWARNVDDRKSTLGGCFYVDNNLVS
ncbi:uncharacterized mitochondrial protein AtMg00810-like [Quercus suber]|uniref:uncharacterized mitochondrial protein AtMg00810-like n=1 Tax=Quercus suber TaxID=58331 RepID=UPI0032DF4EA0